MASKLSVVIPVYNERTTLLRVIDSVRTVPINKEIIVVDDGSTDGTTEIIKKHLSSQRAISVYFHERNLGKGAAVRTGIAAASGDMIIIQDADLEYDPKDYTNLLDVMDKSGANVVFGSRFKGGSGGRAFFHRTTNKAYTGLCNILCGSRLTDLGTGYKLFRSKTIKSLTLEREGFEMEAELTVKLLRNNEHIAEAPISYRRRGYHDGKKITWRDGVRSALCLMQYRFSPQT